MEVRSVERAIDILQCLSQARGPMTVGELQKAIGLSRPTLYRILQTLEKRDLILSSGEPLRFALHYGVFRLGAAWSQSVDITSFGGPILEELRESLGETAALFVPVLPDRRICVLESVSSQTLTFSLGVGDIQSLSVGAAGKALLAFMPDEICEPIVKSVRSKEARAALEEQLAIARRERGLVVSGEVMAEGFGVAAPVFSANGQVCGSLALLGPASRLRAKEEGRYLKEVKRAAEKLSTLLGHSPVASRSRPIGATSRNQG